MLIGLDKCRSWLARVSRFMGTFLVEQRCAEIDHAFGGATLGVPFVARRRVERWLELLVVFARGRAALRVSARLVMSRESIITREQGVARGALLVIFLGSTFPMISRRCRQRKPRSGSTGSTDTRVRALALCCSAGWAGDAWRARRSQRQAELPRDVLSAWSCSQCSSRGQSTTAVCVAIVMLRTRSCSAESDRSSCAGPRARRAIRARVAAARPARAACAATGALRGLWVQRRDLGPVS